MDAERQKASKPVTEHSTLDIRVSGGELHAPAVEPVPSLDDLVSRITAENRHPQVDMGPPVGNEIW